jgi:collagen type VII alpha
VATLSTRINSATAYEARIRNVVLGRGEPFYELDTGGFKVGNGTQKYTELAYAGIVLEQGPPGDQGQQGVPGAPGQSAYAVAVNAGFVGDEAAWLASLKGAQGERGAQGNPGVQGVPGDRGAKGDKGDQGIQGEGLHVDQRVSNYAALQAIPNPPMGWAVVLTSDGLLYIRGASSWPAEGQGVNITGPQGVKGDTGDTGQQGAKGDKGDTGSQGAKGDTGSQGVAGRGFVPRGAWAASTVYAVDNIVTNGGNTYRVTTAHTSPATFSTANLELWASRGTTGSTGPGFVPKGAWTTGLVLAVNDVVTYDGGVYRTTTAHTAGAAFAPANFELWASRGLQGVKGDTGSQGAKGDTGAAGTPGAKGDKGDTGSTGAPGTTSWNGLADKPVVIAQGATAAEARASIGAVTLGTTASTAMRGDGIVAVSSLPSSPVAGVLYCIPE